MKLGFTENDRALQKQAGPYCAVAVLVAVATLLRMALTPLVGAAVPFSTYFVATLVVVWYFGFGLAVFNILLSAATGFYFFVSGAIASPFPPASRVTVIGYVVASFAASFLLDLQRKTLRRMHHEANLRKQAEEQLAALQDQLREELSGMRRLHELGTLLMQESDLSSVLGEILKAAETITGADMGNIQLLGPTGALHIEAQHGFSNEFLEFFNAVQDGQTSACGVALAQGKRVVIEDVERSSIFAGTPALKIMLAAGARAVQATPIISRRGVLVGMLSTHYRNPRQPSERDMRLLDLLARQAADFIEKVSAEEALRESEERYRATFDNAAVGIAHVGLDGRWVRFNEAVCVITAYSREELSTKTFGDITHPDDLDADYAN